MEELISPKLKIKICLRELVALEKALKKTNDEELKKLINKRLSIIYKEKNELMEKYPDLFLIL